MRLVKDVRLSLLLTKVMKIARLTSPLLDVPRQSSPRPKLRHGRRLALLFHPNQTQKLYTLFFALLLALLPCLSSSPNFPNCSSPRESALVYAAYLRSHFSVSQSEAIILLHIFILGYSSSHLQSFLDFTFLSFHVEDIFYYSHPKDGKASRLSFFLPAYLSHLLRLKAF